jgi:hypothetical protein
MTKTKQIADKVQHRKTSAGKIAPSAQTRRKQRTQPVKVGPPTPEPLPARDTVTTQRLSKKTLITTLLRRPDGATLADLTAATGWQVHSIRAAMTGLRKTGNGVGHSKDAAGTTRFRIVADT